MFTLWYSILSWKEYRDVILEKLSKPAQEKPTPETPSPNPPAPLPQVPKPIVPVKLPTPAPPPKQPPPPKLEPPAKPPRSPSPHPLHSEAFDDIEYEEETTSDEEDEEENSVIDSVLQPKRPVANSINDFINLEIQSEQRDSNSLQRKGQGRRAETEIDKRGEKQLMQEPP